MAKVATGCIICQEKSEVEVSKKVSRALGNSVLIVCEKCSKKSPEEIDDEWTRRWLKMMP